MAKSNAAQRLLEKNQAPAGLVRRAVPDLPSLALGDRVLVQLADGRRVRDGLGGFYTSEWHHTVVVTVTLLRQLAHGDLVYLGPADEM